MDMVGCCLHLFPRNSYGFVIVSVIEKDVFVSSGALIVC